MDKTSTQEFQKRLGRVEELIAALESAPSPTVREQVRELIQTVLDLHGTGIERMLSMVYDSAASGSTMIDELSRDQLVSGLLLLHGLHPLDLETRVRNAIEEVKPRLGLHGGSVELLGVNAEGRVHLKLQGNCHDCPSSRLTLRFSIEEALYAAAPDLTGFDLDGLPDEFPKAPVNGTPPAPKFTDCPLPNGNGQRAAAAGENIRVNHHNQSISPATRKGRNSPSITRKPGAARAGRVIPPRGMRPASMRRRGRRFIPICRVCRRPSCNRGR